MILLFVAILSKIALASEPIKLDNVCYGGGIERGLKFGDDMCREVAETLNLMSNDNMVFQVACNWPKGEMKKICPYKFGNVMTVKAYAAGKWRELNQVCFVGDTFDHFIDGESVCARIASKIQKLSTDQVVFLAHLFGQTMWWQ